MTMEESYTLFAGRANVPLAAAIAAHLGIPLAACRVERFPDGELSVRLEASVRGQTVVLVQPTSPPVNEHLMELLLFADACRRAAATRIIALVPYFGYARADKRLGRREPITASLVARLMQAAGINHLITLDPHTSQLEGFFFIPVDSPTAVPVLCEALAPVLPPQTVIVSPDTGRVRMATEYAQRLHTSVVVLHEQRLSGAETEVTQVVGEVRDRPCLIVDDMITTGGTILRSVEALLQAGARPEIIVAATHGVLVGSAREKLSHESIRAIFLTDSLPLEPEARPPIRVVSVAPLLAATLQHLLARGA
jgi:ribose-phosphate pyrophosphokinase